MPPADSRLFNYAGLEAELDKEGVQMLCRLFADDTGPLISQIQQSVEIRNLESVRSLAHALRGCCRSINAVQVERFCEAIEDAAMRGDWVSISMGTNALGPLYVRLAEEVESYIEAQT